VLHNRLLRHDGALSILRSFKAGELLELGQRAGLLDVWVQRRFPFRLVLSAAAQANVHLQDSEARSIRAA
jgi:prepilin signal peptidase PulO-like enzyme (type II secretory pathway)